VKAYSPVTSKDYAERVNAVLRQVPSLDYPRLLAFLKDFKANHSVGYYSSTLGALKVYSRFIGRPDLLSDFAFPHPQVTPKKFWSKAQMRDFYYQLTSRKMQALFLMGATTGLRKGEILSLKIGEIDFTTRTVVPNVHTGVTKHSWVSFYNQECEEALKKHMESMRPAIRARGRLFPMSSRDFKVDWRQAKEKSGVNLKFKDLRDFFAESMFGLGVQSIYIDAMAGRAPASVLAKHYIDLSPQKLKQVYDQASLRILS